MAPQTPSAKPLFNEEVGMGGPSSKPITAAELQRLMDMHAGSAASAKKVTAANTASAPICGISG